MCDIIIKEIPYNKGKYRFNSSALFNAFLDFPNHLYKSNKMWVPPLFMDERNTFNKKVNPALNNCDYKIFLAFRGTEIVGRIVGIVNKKANQIWKRRYIRFGWFDCIDDEEVAFKLLNAVEEWGRSMKLEKIIGPMGFTDMDKEGMIVEGFDTLCPMAAYFNPEYLPKLTEQYGFRKEVDWVQYEIPASQPVPEKMSRINNLIAEKYHLHTVEGLSKREIAKRYGEKVFICLNKAFSGLYGYVPMNDETIQYYIKQYFPFLDKRLICIVVDEKDDVVAFGISMPTLSHAFQKAKGRLLPFGWYYLIRSLKDYNYIDLYLNGVDPDWQNKGVHSIYYAKMNENYIKLGSKMAIANPQLEDNQATHIWTKYSSHIAIRRRAYIKDIPQQ